ncbi:MAG: ABC transporter transmembrane domain-containing protein [Microscillaceae bacterium]|nr:ABC transporter transmembrane domain-containing protein [Microscillaceae bacterium]
MHESKQTEQPSEEKKKKINRKDLQKLLKIFHFVLPYRFLFGLGIFFLALSTLTTLVIPYLSGQFLDVALGNYSGLFSSIRRVIYIFSALLVLQALFSFFRVYIFGVVSEKVMADIRTRLYSKIISLGIPFFEKKRVGELTSRIASDVTQLHTTLSFTIAEFLRQIATLVLGVLYLFIQSVELTLFMVATFPILVLLAVIFGRFIRKQAKKSQDELANSNVIVEETFQSIQAVKAFTNEWYEISRYQKALNQVVKTSIHVATYRGAMISFSILVLFGGIMMVLAYGAYLVERKEMLPGELTSFIIYTIFIGGSLGGMTNLFADLQKSIGASDRILEILGEQSEVDLEKDQSHAVTHLQGKISFREVYFRYPTRTDVEVLKGISLDIEAGQKIALVGHSGAGKSTIVQLLGRYYEIQNGEILIDDQPITGYNISQLRKNIGIVPQEVILFGGTIRENIAYGKPNATEEEIIEAAQRANALNFIQSFPAGLDTLVGERGVKLSGGQRQRIAIARAILKNPAILILDEATSSLDAESEKQVQEALDELMKNRTTIIIAHRLATIRKVDTIYVIDQGQVVETGSHAELSLLSAGIYSHLVKLQFELEEREVDVKAPSEGGNYAN